MPVGDYPNVCAIDCTKSSGELSVNEKSCAHNCTTTKTRGPIPLASRCRAIKANTAAIIWPFLIFLAFKSNAAIKKTIQPRGEDSDELDVKRQRHSSHALDHGSRSIVGRRPGRSRWAADGWRRA